MKAVQKKMSLAAMDGDSHEAMRSLALRLNLSGAGEAAPRIICFIAARAGEGTSTLALKYAALLAEETGKKILLVDASPAPSVVYAGGLGGKNGIIDAALEDSPLDTALLEMAPKLNVVRWVSKLQNRSVADRIMQNPEFWKRLQGEFGYIVIDAPSLQNSFDGIVLSAKADATVMVVEAEATPTPVTQHLRDTLLNAGVNIAGIVLNKRRYYIPQKVYNKL